MPPLRKAEARLQRKLSKKQKTASPQQPLHITLPDLEPKNPNQKKYLYYLETAPQVFALGPAGCGKTFVATYWAIKALLDKKFTRLVVTRPMVSSDSNENIGFLPGDLNSKFTPWALPILDTIVKLVGRAKTTDWLKNGVIEFAPFQFMRGRTFDDECIVLLDEAQNCSLEQLRLFLTRLGECKTVISGDPTPGQCDIINSGLTRTVSMVLEHKIDAKVCRFVNGDIVRSKLCQSWVEAFETEFSSERKVNGET